LCRKYANEYYRRIIWLFYFLFYFIFFQKKIIFFQGSANRKNWGGSPRLEQMALPSQTRGRGGLYTLHGQYGFPFSLCCSILEAEPTFPGFCSILEAEPTFPGTGVNPQFGLLCSSCLLHEEEYLGDGEYGQNRGDNDEVWCW
jgi:hypothetical protein